MRLQRATGTAPVDVIAMVDSGAFRSCFPKQIAYDLGLTDADLTEDAVLGHCTEFLARYKRPSKVKFIDELPRNASQKVLKRVLREEAVP